MLLLSATAGMAQAPQPNPADPKYQSKGEQDRAYTFPGTSESIAYHIYVPAKWDKNTKLPLIILTHGASQPATAPFQRPMQNPTLAKTAEARGYIVAAVTGYHANATIVGGWNVPYGMIAAPRPARQGGGGGGAGQGGGGRGGATPAAAATPEDFQRAEMDILHVTDLMAKEYNVDTNRIYLMGNSSGGSAVWNLGAKYPERWTAISPSAAPLEDATFPYEKLKTLPVLVVHGDMDTTMSFDGSKLMVDHAKAKGVDATWLPVPGGAHTDAWALQEILDKTFDFYEAHKTKTK
jgi:poly(3-hydroxybutyrate) depolymerase